MQKNDEFLKNISIPPHAYRNVPSYRALEQDKQSTESAVATKNLDFSLQPLAQPSEGKQRVEGRRSGRLERPSGNLIRRDDSWQSLVSLTQVGKSNAPGVQKQSLHAQHQQHSIEGPTPNDGIHIGQFSAAQRQSQRQHLLNLEPTATPIRNRPPMRQHSMQAYHSPRLLPQPIGRQHQRHANSFDVPSLPASPSLQSNQQQTASYQQKLLQLQLLHNSNNVDYIRGNKCGHTQDANNNDYQVYGPGSIATNHYGYYSMRSNLKSAASEFSFIRPSSSNFQHQQQPAQLTEVVSERNSSYMLDGHARRIDNEGKLIVSRDNNPIEVDFNNNNHHQLIAQYPMNNVEQTFQQLAAIHPAQNGQDRLTLAELTAPNRDLPLRPNKKRAAANPEVANKKNSLVSSIVCFFKRAFSRRSKRRRPKLVESCSSSLAAFDSNFENIQISRSAFSTGSKSAKVAERMQHLQHVNQTSVSQPQRMIDLIEAFANQTATDRIGSEKSLIQVNQSFDNRERQTYIHNNQQNPQPQRPVQNFLISPLHKSSSMSASIDFSGSNELSNRGQDRRFPNGDINHLGGHCPSPMASRSTKVMSANLTPLFVRKETHETQAEMSMASKKSSRNNLPRPSSIYGQPSLIASPSSVVNVKDGEQFGLHRSSLHAGSNRERIASLIMDSRRQQQQQQQPMKMSYLDTTREVAEEISSPTSESRDLVSNLGSSGIFSGRTNNVIIDNNNINNTVNTSNNYGQYQRHAIVNPILQSPTVSAIYDNHPMVTGQVREAAYSSHYDNHHPMVHNLNPDDVNQTHQLFDNALLAGGINQNSSARNSYHDGLTAEAIISPLISNRFVQDERVARSSTNQTGAFYTPIRGVAGSNMIRFNRDDKMSSLADGERVFVHHTKPAAIVAPTTPNRQADYQRVYSKYPPSSSSDRDHEETPSCSNMRLSGQRAHQQQNNSPMRAQERAQNASAVSPKASRRFINQTATSYQQSPLVNDQTHILKRNDGVQATIIGSDSGANANIGGEPVVNIVGAPGVNLDPALAAVLLRGTNIDAFQSSTTSRASSSGQPNSSTKTFLISSRLSRACPKNSTTIAAIADLDNDISGSCEPEIGVSKVVKREQDDRGDGTSSAGSRSSSSSEQKTTAADDAERAVTKQPGTRSKSTTSDNGPRSREASSSGGSRSSSGSGSNGNSGSRATSNLISNGKTRGSSTEQSDEMSSQTGSIDEPEEKNWINSKLV